MYLPRPLPARFRKQTAPQVLKDKTSLETKPPGNTKRPEYHAVWQYHAVWKYHAESNVVRDLSAKTPPQHPTRQGRVRTRDEQPDKWEGVIILEPYPAVNGSNPKQFGIFGGEPEAHEEKTSTEGDCQISRCLHAGTDCAKCANIPANRSDGDAAIRALGSFPDTPTRAREKSDH